MSDLSLVIYRASSQSCHLKHEGQRVLQVALERRQPPGTHCTVDHAVVRAESHLHDVGDLEALLLFRSRYKGGLCRANGEDTRLGWVDDGSEVRDAKHAEVGDGECATLESRR